MRAIKSILLALLTASIIKFFVFDFIIARGHSMEPAIQDGDVLIVSRLRYGFRFPWMRNYIVRWDYPREGEVVIFYTPESKIAVKRCVSSYRSNFTAEGDNSLASYDSRAYGKISADNIIGKVLGHK